MLYKARFCGLCSREQHIIEGLNYDMMRYESESDPTEYHIYTYYFSVYSILIFMVIIVYTII